MMIIELEQGWEIMEKGIESLINTIEGLPAPKVLTSQDLITLYTTVYTMCTQDPPHDYSQHLYERYSSTIHEYLSSTVLPFLRGISKLGNEEILLKQFLKKWVNHKNMLKWLNGFFGYLDRYFVPRMNALSVNEVAMVGFHDVVYQEMKGVITDSIVSMINREREGGRMDRGLVKNVLGVFVEIGGVSSYERDFEGVMVNASKDYYSRKAFRWVQEDSYSDYSLKAEECMKREKDRVSKYLPCTSELKLLTNVKHVFDIYADQLLQRQRSECYLMQEKLKDMKIQ